MLDVYDNDQQDANEKEAYLSGEQRHFRLLDGCSCDRGSSHGNLHTFNSKLSLLLKADE